MHTLKPAIMIGHDGTTGSRALPKTESCAVTVENRRPVGQPRNISRLGFLGFAFQGALQGVVEGGFAFFVFLL